jgi:L-rhamnose mutarotase
LLAGDACRIVETIHFSTERSASMSENGLDSAAAFERVCFQLQVKPERIAEYRDRHAAVWPDMLRALEQAGWHNYSLFLRDDGLLIGYVETRSIDDARAAMAATDVNARWQAEMGEFFVDLDVAPDEGFVRLEEVFHLEDQLAALGAPGDPGDPGTAHPIPAGTGPETHAAGDAAGHAASDTSTESSDS